MAFLNLPTVHLGEPHVQEPRVDSFGGRYLYVRLAKQPYMSICLHSSAEAQVIADAFALAATRLAEAETALIKQALTATPEQVAARQAERAPLISDATFAEIARVQAQRAFEENADVL